MLVLAGCATSNNVVQDSNSNANQQEEPDMATICSGLCGRTIQDLCRDEIQDFANAGQSLDGSIMDEASCQLMCEAEWTIDTIECVRAADDCAQFVDDHPYCMETEVKDEEAGAVDPSLPGNCDRACKNYSKCASYGDDVTSQDLQDAYNSCLEICGTWDDATRNCVSNTAISDPSDCGAQAACVLKDVRDMMGR